MVADSIGGNFPPSPIDPLDDIDPEHLVDPTIIDPLLRRNYADLERRRDELVPGARRWLDAHTITGHIEPVISDDADAAATADFLKQLASFAGAAGEVEITRKRVKEPVLAASRTIDAWFNDSVAAPVRLVMLEIRAAADTYVAEREARLEAERLAEQRRLAAEAAELLRQAEQAKSDAMRAELAERAAEAASAVTSLPMASPTPIRGHLGSIMSARRPWHAEVTDLMALVRAVADGRAPLHYLKPDIGAIETDARTRGVKDVPGISITRPVKSGVR